MSNEMKDEVMVDVLAKNEGKEIFDEQVIRDQFASLLPALQVMLHEMSHGQDNEVCVQDATQNLIQQIERARELVAALPDDPKARDVAEQLQRNLQSKSIFNDKYDLEK